MDNMAAVDLSLATMRSRQSTLSSFCAWLVKRAVLTANPVNTLDRRPRDVAIFLILRHTGIRRESVATLRVGHLDAAWGLRGVRVKGARPGTSPYPAP